MEIWRRLGFNAFSLSINDLLAGLQSGMADACYAPLLAAASFQWFGAVRYMPSLPVAPVLGGVLFSQAALAEVPADLLPALLEAFRGLERSLNARMAALEQEALDRHAAARPGGGARQRGGGRPVARAGLQRRRPGDRPVHFAGILRLGPGHPGAVPPLSTGRYRHYPWLPSLIATASPRRTRLMMKKAATNRSEAKTISEA